MTSAGIQFDRRNTFRCASSLVRRPDPDPCGRPRRHRRGRGQDDPRPGKDLDLEFSEVRGRALASRVVGGILPYLLSEGSEGIFLSSAKTVPVVGPLASFIAMRGFAPASTYTVGKAFAQHLAGGGNLIAFDTEAKNSKKIEIKKEFDQVCAEARNGRQGRRESKFPILYLDWWVVPSETVSDAAGHFAADIGLCQL
jgi:hypothetical protein